MSVINAVSIQGIRSFDPSKPQIVEFFKPVTLILGQNGSGKTTIIESLKYATTGDLPPGAKVGACFIHDPKIAKEPEVKAKIALQFHDIKGDEICVSRALKAILKDNNQVSMQTLDSSIKRQQNDGDIASISSKCSDIDFEITNSIGVSRAVLENVIFCHQEEANWPLMEGKVVKQRFDDLFASAKYVKVLDALRKIKLEKDSHIKLYKTELKYIRVDREEAVKKLDEKLQLENSLSKIVEQLEQFRERISPIEKALEGYQAKYKETCRIEGEIQYLLRDKSSNESRIKELQKNISQNIQGTIEELEDRIKNFDDEVLEYKKGIGENDDKITALRKEISGWEKENGYSLVEKGSLQLKMDNLKSNKNKLQQSVVRLCNELSVEYDETSPLLMIKRFQEKIEEEENILNEKKKIAEEDITKHQSEVEAKNSEKTQLRVSCDLLEKQIVSSKNELTDIERKLADIDESSSKLETISNTINDLKNKLNSVKETFDSNILRDKIEELSASVKTYEQRLEGFNDKIGEFQKRESKYKDIDKLANQKMEKFSNIKRLRSRHTEVLEKLFEGSVPESGIRKKLNESLNKLRMNIHDLQTQIVTHQTAQTTINMEIKQMRQKIAEKKSIVQKFEEKVFEVCGSFDFQKSMEEVRQKKSSLEEDIVSLQGTCSLYRKFQESLEKEKEIHDCPLCHREFENDCEKNDLMDELNQKLTDFPPILQTKSEELVTVNEQFENLLKLESRAESITELRRKYIDEFDKNLEIKMKELADEQEALSKLNSKKDNVVNIEKEANMIQGDIAVIEKLNEEVVGIERQIQKMNSEMPQGQEEFLRDFNKVREEKAVIQNEMNDVKEQLEAKRKSFDVSLNKENKLTAEINQLDSERLSIQQNVQEFTNLWSQKEKLISEIGNIQKYLMEKKKNLEPIDEELNNLKDQLTTVKRKHGLEENDLKERIFGFRSRVKELEKMLANIKYVEKEDFQIQLKELEEKRVANMKKIEQNNSIIREINEVIDDLKGKIQSQKVHQREIQDTINIINFEENIKKIDENLAELRVQLGGYDSVTLQGEERRMENDRRLINKEIDHLEAKKTQAQTKKSYIEKELQERFSEVETKYMDIVYKLKTTELASSDLEKYSRALDRSIMSYHSSKMAEINKILKELWRNTYNGKDIDYIEICSDEDSGISGVAQGAVLTARRRTYNYRVVMVKSDSGVRLDMRGRCSAGQRVLASLLIRLSLAEVFCLQCGVLALDEPTTNLDQENIENLAFALIQIIKNRCKQKNFQLIVITHDEDFVQLLGRSDFVDEYYKIIRDKEGHSQVEKMGIN